MRAVVQRVRKASVKTKTQKVSSIDKGIFVLLGISKEDTSEDVQYMAKKIAGLRIFEDENGKMNLSVKDIDGSILLVPQFTLYGDCRKGRRPSFGSAANPSFAEKLYQNVSKKLKSHQIDIELGAFKKYMEISSVNDGPVTLLLDSNKKF